MQRQPPETLLLDCLSYGGAYARSRHRNSRRCETRPFARRAGSHFASWVRSEWQSQLTSRPPPHQTWQAPHHPHNASPDRDEIRLRRKSGRGIRSKCDAWRLHLLKSGGCSQPHPHRGWRQACAGDVFPCRGALLRIGVQAKFYRAGARVASERQDSGQHRTAGILISSTPYVSRWPNPDRFCWIAWPLKLVAMLCVPSPALPEFCRSLPSRTKRRRFNRLGSSLGSFDSSGRVIDFRLYALSQLLFRDEQVVTRLQVHPKLRAVAKISREPERCIRTDRPLPIQNRRDPPRRYA